MRVLVAAMLLLLSITASAARLPVSWDNPDTNTDGSALTDLASVYVEWGSCNPQGNDMGLVQGHTSVPTTAVGAKMHTTLYPSGLTKVCIRAKALTTGGVQSSWSNVLVKDLLPVTGKPVTLGQPIQLP
jgi:hypothetical protein